MSIWPLDPVSAGILAALIAAIAGLGGAGLNARLTTRRERWTFKRDLYVRLLEHLHEATVLLAAWIRNPQVDRIEQLTKAAEEVRRAQAVGRLVLHAEAAKAITELEAIWRAGDPDPRSPQVLQQRNQALDDAYERVLSAARRDLRL